MKKVKVLSVGFTLWTYNFAYKMYEKLNTIWETPMHYYENNDQSSITLRIIESEEWKKQYLLLLFCSYCYWMVIGSLSKCSEPKVRERIFFVLLPNAIKCSRKVVIWRKIEKIVFAEVILIVNALFKSHATSCMSQKTKTKQNLSFVFCWSVWRKKKFECDFKIFWFSKNCTVFDI